MMEQTSVAPAEPPAAPAPASSPPRRSRTPLIAIAALAILLIVIAGYAAIGFAFAQARISAADRSLNTVVSHENELNSTFADIDKQFSSLGTGAAFNAAAARNLTDQFVTKSQAAAGTIDADDASLAKAANGLTDQQWLTIAARGNLDREAVRIRHARSALANARMIAAGHVADGQFLQSFFGVLVDLDKFSTQGSAGDYTGAASTLATMKADAATALQRSSAPGLPPEIHALATDLQTMVTDFGSWLNATQAGNDAGVTAAEQSLEADATKISAYNFDTIKSKIDAYYKPLVDGFNSEMSAATS